MGLVISMVLFSSLIGSQDSRVACSDHLTRFQKKLKSQRLYNQGNLNSKLKSLGNNFEELKEKDQLLRQNLHSIFSFLDREVIENVLEDVFQGLSDFETLLSKDPNLLPLLDRAKTNMNHSYALIPVQAFGLVWSYDDSRLRQATVIALAVNHFIDDVLESYFHPKTKREDNPSLTWPFNMINVVSFDWPRKTISQNSKLIPILHLLEREELLYKKMLPWFGEEQAQILRAARDRILSDNFMHSPFLSDFERLIQRLKDRQRFNQLLFGYEHDKDGFHVGYFEEIRKLGVKHTSLTVKVTFEQFEALQPNPDSLKALLINLLILPGLYYYHLDLELAAQELSEEITEEEFAYGIKLAKSLIPVLSPQKRKELQDVLKSYMAVYQAEVVGTPALAATLNVLEYLTTLSK